MRRWNREIAALVAGSACAVLAAAVRAQVPVETRPEAAADRAAVEGLTLGRIGDFDAMRGLSRVR